MGLVPWLFTTKSAAAALKLAARVTVCSDAKNAGLCTPTTRVSTDPGVLNVVAPTWLMNSDAVIPPRVPRWNQTNGIPKWMGVLGSLLLLMSHFVSSGAQGEPLLTLHERLVEGWLSQQPDPTDPQAMFAYVFAKLPDEVTVYPSENYYYFQIQVSGRAFWGNLRLANGMREQGIVSFAYAEFLEFPLSTTNRLVRSWLPGKNDGVVLQETAPLDWRLTYQGKSVRFRLHALRQEPPTKFALGPDETFVMRTFDESGCQFFLLFHSGRKHFFWVLNEEEPVPDTFDSVSDDVVIGRRTGFAFWVDRARSQRRVLVAVRKASAQRNDYFDGPFDQLADNDVEKTRIAEFIQKAYPITRGKIDKYGYWTNRTDYQRVGLACYGSYESPTELAEFMARAKAAPSLLEFIGRAQDGRARTKP